MEGGHDRPPFSVPHRMTSRAHIALDWTEPLSVAAGLSCREGALALLAGAGDTSSHGGRWSYVACEPDRVAVHDLSPDLFAPLSDPEWHTMPVVALASYDGGARPATGAREALWPDLMLARYRAVLAFDHRARTVHAFGFGTDAAAMAQKAAGWLASARVPQMPLPPSRDLVPMAGREVYEAAVADTVRRIGAGEIFQANIARGWRGALTPDASPFDVLVRLSRRRGAAYGAWLRLGDRALVSNSPELFLAFDGATRRLETRPIKGTRPRGTDAAGDAALATELVASAKDRAENLMIVDLMRNDLGRVAVTGTVRVEQLCGLETHPTVHHLTSVVSATVREGVTVGQILAATFPAGSITGAPKHQAMKVIADHEPPRGIWCGSLVALGFGGPDDMIASVLIRTASFRRVSGVWQWQAMAGAGITADSDPVAEADETAAKITALCEALTGGSPDS